MQLSLGKIDAVPLNVVPFSSFSSDFTGEHNVEWCEYILSQLGVGCVPSQPLVHPQPVEFCGQVRRDKFGSLRASLQGQENTALLLSLFKPQIQNTALYGLL